MKIQRAALRSTLILTALAALSACTLQNQVAITPVFLLPDDIRPRGANVIDLEANAEYGRAANYAPMIEAKERPSVAELLALGSAQMAAGRLEQARQTLRRALDLRPSSENTGKIAWALSQTEYLANNYASALEWAEMARSHGIGVRSWHIDFLQAFAGEQVYGMPSRHAALADIEMGSPDIPRLPVAVNDEPLVTAIIDTGAVMSIISSSLAEKVGLAPRGDFQGTFVGLLGEPILVRFGVLDRLVIGDLEINKIPVAIMADDKLQFFVYNQEPFSLDLLLGTSLLKEFRVELDFQREVATFQPLEPPDRKPDRDQNLFFVGFRPFVQAAISRKGWYHFVVDTGSEVTFLNANRIAETPVRRALRYHGAMLQGLGGARRAGEKVEDIEITVDAWGGKFRNIPLYASEQSPAFGILGQNYLKNFRVVIDFGSMRLDLFRDRGEFQRTAAAE